ncbi:MAG: RNA-binding protein [Candidatus Wallbacteria bacterium HGW-Wallbacteria-1]|jgi:uncharacterized protein|uniref:RNA-binding protein n=1 Tax=Candidatus Wallbacteria bacterium HGW-Wallbacteria-1 TaxID=2013854 RepID=A0A2N1PJH9_9BACT|nr:MAG: RNA-binding protein [Candidatus Wallbacteria bacterium HGW-Wallbacteria-1]
MNSHNDNHNDNPELIALLSASTKLPSHRCEAIINLMSEGATIPFIARYRKEVTGGATDEQLREFGEAWDYSKKLIQRRDEILRLIAERSTLDSALARKINSASTLAELEDLYRPFREKKNTRAGVAIAQGLEPLADLLEQGRHTPAELLDRAAAILKSGSRGTSAGDACKSVDAGKSAAMPKTPADALKGAQDIIAERFSDDPRERQILREQAQRHGIIETRPGKEYDEKGVYTNYREHSERVAYIPSHRFLAIMRGVREKQLTVKVALDTDRVLDNIRKFRIPRNSRCADLHFEACRDGLKRLLLPSIEREILAATREKSDIQAISTFGRNLSQLLMTPGVRGMAILGVDPAFRTGCKLAVINENGKVLDHGVIYPTPPHSDYEKSRDVVMAMVKRHGIRGVSIGNGTGSRETQEFFARLNRDEKANLKYTVVSEAGASVYSASKLAQQEFPDLDVTIRGAISIARRLLDPMAELVKIDPKSLGIGQYQHDVDQKLLERKLGEVTEALVNRVGVDLNSASASLLGHVAGIGPVLAANILSHREKSGPFATRRELLSVKGLGRKAFEQCAGFLRIRSGDCELDNTGVHPENYSAARALQRRWDVQSINAGQNPDSGSGKAEEGCRGHLSRENSDEVTKIALELGIGSETLRDIILELRKPGFDPRDELPEIPFRDDILDISALKEGSVVSGVVRNITDFGAFVDIGLKNDGLIHISKISDHRISHPLEILSVNQFLPSIRVVAVDHEKGKVGLSLT